MAFREFSFKSYNGVDNVQAWGHMPYNSRPKGILHIVHGYGEHVRRFSYMIERFLDAGYAVYGADTVGFGKTAEVNGDWGYPGDKGYVTYVRDQKSLHDSAAADFPGVPYFMYGFSMGSCITRLYAAAYPEDLAGILMDGVLCRWKNADRILAEGVLEAEIGRGEGKTPDDGTWASRIFIEGMVDHLPEGSAPMAWMAVDPDLLRDNLEDPLNMDAHVPTKQILWNLMDAYRAANSASCVDSIPADMPMYMFGGDGDPSCGCGEGVYVVANAFKSRGNKNITVHLNPGYRHEVHKEPAVKEAIMTDMIAFTEKVAGK